MAARGRDHRLVGPERPGTVLATCPDPKDRDPARAVVIAMEAWRRAEQEWQVGRSKPNLAVDSRAETLDTLAAARAAAGDYGEATAIEQRAIGSLSGSATEAERSQYQARLIAYRAGHSWLDYPRLR